MRPISPDVGDRVPPAEQVVADAFKAFEAQEWQRLVELTESDSIVALRKTYVAHKSRPEVVFPMPDPGVTLSETDERVMEYFASRKKFGELAGITTMQQVDALSNEEFLIRWAQARDYRYLVNGVAPWHDQTPDQPRVVVGSVAVMPDLVAVVVRVLGTAALNSLGTYSMVAVLGDGAGTWHLDAATGWLGLADFYV
jgi:hypothetical protein